MLRDYALDDSLLYSLAAAPAMRIEPVDPADRPSASQQALDMWAAMIAADPGKELGDQIEGAIGDMLKGIKGSDVRLPDAVASQPGDRGSAAPQVEDLNGETARLSPQVWAAQRLAIGAPIVQLADDRQQALPTFMHEHPAVSAAAPTQTSAAPGGAPAAPLGGEVRDGQAGDTLGSNVFGALFVSPPPR